MWEITLTNTNAAGMILQAPSKASPFVSSVLNPVREFLEQHQALVGQQQRQAWAAAILQALLLK